MGKMKILKFIFRYKCKHDYVNTNEEWSIFGKDHITKVCVKCGKRVY